MAKAHTTLHLKVWRQADSNSEGRLEDYMLEDIPPDAYFLDVLDKLNEQLEATGEEPITFDHACRDANCGRCSLTVNGIPHGPKQQATICRTPMQHFDRSNPITVEPFRSKPFPVVKDLKVDVSVFDKIIEAGGYMLVKTSGGYISMDTGQYIAARPKAEDVINAVEGAACINCGACVAACSNGSASLFTGAKLAHMNSLEENATTRDERSLNMVSAMDENGFGACSSYGQCQQVCPKGITLNVIAQMNKSFGKGVVRTLLGKNRKKKEEAVAD